MSLLSQLRQWRDAQARTEGVETFRVFPNAVLEALVVSLPQTKEAMLAIKGIKEAKYRKYGTPLLKILSEHTGGSNGTESDFLEKKSETINLESVDTEEGDNGEQTISVSQFLDGLNTELSGMASRVQGEVSSVDERDRVVYFTLKDSFDESTLNCLIFRYQYEISGVKITIGDEIIVEGVPEIYKPSGRMSMKVGVIELFGEGALKKAYDELKLKLDQEGLFAPERKRTLPKFPERIALITSEQGAAIGDFTMNLGAQGLKVHFYPTSVEGKKAVFEVMRAIRFFNERSENYDVLVIVRGGGSLESLQAFNNEALTRAVAVSKIPTLLGVGHEKDVTLSALVADVMVSTPTATAKELRQSFDEARQLIRHFEVQLPTLFREQLSLIKNTLGAGSESLLGHLQIFRDLVSMLRQELRERLYRVQSMLEKQSVFVKQARSALLQGYTSLFQRVAERLNHESALLERYDPTRVLKLGYSLVRNGTKVVKDISDAKIGDILQVQLSRGKINTRVVEIFDN